MQCGVLGTMCALVIGLYAYLAGSGPLESMTLSAADTYYNLLVQGFCAGQLSLKKEPPPELALLPDPYDPATNAPFRPRSNTMHDLSYYKGKLYLYFGATPALILFWPFAALTGRYLFHREAMAIFCALGFLTGSGLLYAVWRRYFSEVRVWVVAACVLALGLATGAPVLLPLSDVYEVPISCGYLLTMLTLGSLWCALHTPERRGRWLAAASVAYGLAVGARPNLLFGAAILLVPVVQAWCERRRVGIMLLAAIGPIALLGLGLLLYNYLRFENPFEFGLRYELGPARMQLDKLRFFSLPYLWFNFRVYFLEPAQWSLQFPFAHPIVVPPLPSGRGQVETPFGALTNIPLVWLALAAPMAWWKRTASEHTPLQWFLAAVALAFAINTFVLCLFRGANFRYELDFLPALMLLAVVGILGLERALAPNDSLEPAGRTVWRRVAHCGWGVLLGFSVGFNLLVGFGNVLQADYHRGNGLLLAGRLEEAIGIYEQVLRISPDAAEVHNNLGNALARVGRTPEAIGHYEQALRLKPGGAEGHSNLGNALVRAGRVEEAIGHFEQALRLNPDLAEAHTSLANALAGTGRLQEAIGHYELGLRIRPGYGEARHRLGQALLTLGRVQEAIEQFEQVLQSNPDLAEAHCSLGKALALLDRIEEAIEHLEQALRIEPDYVEAHFCLGYALLRLGRVPEAIGHCEEALRISPNNAELHWGLGVALEQAGRLPEAIAQYEQALRIRPDLTKAQTGLARLRSVN